MKNGLPLIPGLLRARLPIGLSHGRVVELQHRHNLVAGLLLHNIAARALLEELQVHRTADVRVAVALRPARHVLQQILTAHQPHLQRTGDGGAAAHRRRVRGRLAAVRPVAERLQAGVVDGRRAERLRMRQLFLQLDGDGRVGGQLLFAQLQRLAQQVQLLAAGALALHRLRTFHSIKNTSSTLITLFYCATESDF